MKLKNCVTALLLMIAVNCTPTHVEAQDFPDPDDPPDTSVPFDGGVTILIAAGVVYGLKKRYEHKKQVTEKYEH